jgi:hypothetical protein
VLVTLVVVAAGFLPTRRLAGETAIPAMAVGCGISLLAAVLTGAFLMAVDAPTPRDRMRRAFFAMTLRLVVVALLGAATVSGGELARRPLLFWLAVSYVALLPLEARLAIGSE